MDQHSVKFDRLLEKMKEEIETLKEVDNHLSIKLDSLLTQVGTLDLHVNKDFQANNTKLDLAQNKRANDSLITRKF